MEMESPPIGNEIVPSFDSPTFQLLLLSKPIKLLTNEIVCQEMRFKTSSPGYNRAADTIIP